ncbi:hypothetical protein HF1_04800 [Mycoplasma haemofelis str. Langford 1]|uniref:Uncharacterized protein n=1 Tax=Mycoplasma haemofelis (strain Langford 1) TaxID=941640 RepID=E8ZH67_MYCHL|nr:hypothetical protein [Mycoplasma haemofelis]CBY92488.1 hypothetical protein HF1_04800 [Mycoplasma haemofelis str. Langford 1]
MSTSLIKGLTALTGAAAVGGGALLFSNISNKTPNTVAYHLEKIKNLKLITSLPSSEVNVQWIEEYNIDKEAIKKVLTEINSDDSNGGAKLREWCESQISKEFKGNEDLSKVERWCTIGKISHRIPSGKNLISGGASAWTSIYDSSTPLKHKDKLQLLDSQESNDKDNNLAKVKKFCEETKDKDFLASKKADEYDVFIEWCIS